jgi:hypothetical protein
MQANDFRWKVRLRDKNGRCISEKKKWNVRLRYRKWSCISEIENGNCISEITTTKMSNTAFQRMRDFLYNKSTLIEVRKKALKCYIEIETILFYGS